MRRCTRLQKEPSSSQSICLTDTERDLNNLSKQDQSLWNTSLPYNIIKGSQTSLDVNKSGSQTPIHVDVNKSESQILLDVNKSRSQTPQDVKKSGSHTPVVVNESGSQTPLDVSKSESRILLGVNKSRFHTPLNVNKSGSHPPQDVSKFGSQIPLDVNKSGSHPPQDVSKSGSQTSLDVNKLGSQTPLDVNKSRSQTPQDVNKSADINAFIELSKRNDSAKRQKPLFRKRPSSDNDAIMSPNEVTSKVLRIVLSDVVKTAPFAKSNKSVSKSQACHTSRFSKASSSSGKVSSEDFLKNSSQIDASVTDSVKSANDDLNESDTTRRPLDVFPTKHRKANKHIACNFPLSENLWAKDPKDTQIKEDFLTLSSQIDGSLSSSGERKTCDLNDCDMAAPKKTCDLNDSDMAAPRKTCDLNGSDMAARRKTCDLNDSDMAGPRKTCDLNDSDMAGPAISESFRSQVEVKNGPQESDKYKLDTAVRYVLKALTEGARDSKCVKGRKKRLNMAVTAREHSEIKSAQCLVIESDAETVTKGVSRLVAKGQKDQLNMSNTVREQNETKRGVSGLVGKCQKDQLNMSNTVREQNGTKREPYVTFIPDTETVSRVGSGLLGKGLNDHLKVGDTARENWEIKSEPYVVIELEDGTIKEVVSVSVPKGQNDHLNVSDTAKEHDKIKSEPYVVTEFDTGTIKEVGSERAGEGLNDRFNVSDTVRELDEVKSEQYDIMVRESDSETDTAIEFDGKVTSNKKRADDMENFSGLVFQLDGKVNEKKKTDAENGDVNNEEAIDIEDMDQEVITRRSTEVVAEQSVAIGSQSDETKGKFQAFT